MPPSPLLKAAHTSTSYVHLASRPFIVYCLCCELISKTLLQLLDDDLRYLSLYPLGFEISEGGCHVTINDSVVGCGSAVSLVTVPKAAKRQECHIKHNNMYIIIYLTNVFYVYRLVFCISGSPDLLLNLEKQQVNLIHHLSCMHVYQLCTMFPIFL